MVARIEAPGGALELDSRVVEAIAAREGVSEAEAREQALDQLRWVAARRVELDERETPPEHPDELDPARRAHLERAALVRLWLTTRFEPEHEAADIPARVIAQNLADPSLSRRLFHPELWFVCQALLVPAAKGDDGRHLPRPSEDADPAAAARWLGDADSAFAPVVARIQAVADELVTDNDCELLGRIVGLSESELATPSGAMKLRFERFVFASNVESFDPEWLATVTAKPEPGLVGPFPSQFGLHLVLVDRLLPAELADGSQPEAELAAAREAAMRAELVEPWRADQLQRVLGEARDRRVVRLAPGLE